MGMGKTKLMNETTVLAGLYNNYNYNIKCLKIWRNAYYSKRSISWVWEKQNE